MSKPQARQRLSREERHIQLIKAAWQIIREEGTEALTLGHLAERAGVTKPVVYDHFTNRSGLLAALYKEYDARQTAIMDDIIRKTEPVLDKLAAVIATSYIDCVLLQGREMPNVMAALTGTPELEQIRQEYDATFTEKCRNLFAPFCAGKPPHDAALRAMLGSAEGLSYAAVKGIITEQQAKDELFHVIVAMVQRCSAQR
ncbi:TetR/AcrR family transcriptional regulator [Pectobacterium versatile]|uniref:TetR family transcriptional regulator n=1 Tax=Pectobacterium versatile TaxID=2488639 RepID=A0A855M6U6_9GAMM|nr:TetR/AcrR family transcriptional regulator [Pectobacterium versatile]MBA0157953.1 TetR/AcrR family transcriptional regulator [Pectobacterium versatile]MBQ4780955.1 TetR family transcriptional regulator [Pectobacterium versatile]MBQ4785512.1 TetR family transcriptional regulator [Pectobacterium versatile]MCA6913845.1 TetR/AcrR family transcriptional regulator [Pectobacterium versatile]MCA6926060.1 TetR/AcrR family transcriptional regulator [Pectobacterium versatile]